jgi:hypothetical protein
MNEAKTAKTFRAAAARILRQEALGDDPTAHFLGVTVAAERAITTDADEWALRLESLAEMAHWDAVVVAAAVPEVITRAHNVTTRVVLDSVVAGATAEAARSRGPLQVFAQLPLRDGRIADAALVVPLLAVHGVEGSLIVLRAGRGFGAADAQIASSAAAVTALDVLRTANAHRDERTVRQSLALFEITRRALGGGETTLGDLVELISASLAHDVAEIWTLRTGGSLQLRAAHPREAPALEIARPRDHAALRDALSGELVHANDPTLRSWLPRTTRDLIVAPLQAADGPAGVLVLGRWRAAYDAEDVDMAAACARFIGGAVVGHAAWRRSSQREALLIEDEETPELTGS